MWLNAMRVGLHPIATAASTNRDDRNVIALERVTRMNRGIPISAIATTTLAEEPPRTCTNTMAMTMMGSAETASTTRIMNSPPRPCVANSPRGTPTSRASAQKPVATAR